MGSQFQILSSKVGPEDRVSALASKSIQFEEALTGKVRWRTATLVLAAVVGVLVALLLVGITS